MIDQINPFQDRPMAQGIHLVETTMEQPRQILGNYDPAIDQDIITTQDKNGELRLVINERKRFGSGKTGVASNAEGKTEQPGTYVTVQGVMAERQQDNYHETVGNAFNPVDKITGGEIITATVAYDQIQTSTPSISETDLQNGNLNPETYKDGSHDHQSWIHRSLLNGQIDRHDITMNERLWLPYEELRCPVFQLDVQGHLCTFMLDTGSTCNIAFPNLIKRFPKIKLLPCGQIVSGIGGMTKPMEGKLHLAINIGSQTLTEAFMVSDQPIANLDGLVGISLLKNFQSWSVGGTAGKGAYLEINGIYLKLCGYGIKDGKKIEIMMIENNKHQTGTTIGKCCYTTSVMDKYSVEEDPLSIECVGKC